MENEEEYDFTPLKPTLQIVQPTGKDDTLTYQERMTQKQYEMDYSQDLKTYTEVELGILFFVDKIHVTPHVTSLHKSHHNHITTMSQVKVLLLMHMSLRYLVPNSSDVAPRGSIHKPLNTVL